jgi:hypothetical protein
MRRAKSEANTTHTIGGVERRYTQREKPSLPKMPWDEEPVSAVKGAPDHG